MRLGGRIVIASALVMLFDRFGLYSEPIETPVELVATVAFVVVGMYIIDVVVFIGRELYRHPPQLRGGADE